MSEPASRNDDKAAVARTAAFFDVDGTLLTVQSGILYIRNLRRNGLMRFMDMVRISWAFITYRMGVMNVARLAAVTSRWLAGRTEESVLEHSEAWYEAEVSARYSAEMLDRLYAHTTAGHTVALLTSGTRYLTDWVCRDLDIEHALATRVEVIDGRFTGRAILPFCYGKGKVFWAEQFAKEQGVDLDMSYFYTDSIADLPMLERVGHPVVVNPDRRLRAQARKRGWPVIDSRVESAADARRRAA